MKGKQIRNAALRRLSIVMRYFQNKNSKSVPHNQDQEPCRGLWHVERVRELVEIVGWGGGAGKMKWLYVSSLHRDDAVLVLQHAFDDEK